MNPFITDRPVPAEELINRTQEWRTLLERATDAHNTRLSAPRRYGKTTLLKKVLLEADRTGMAAVYVDFFGVLSPDEMLLRIEEAYGRALKGALSRWFAGVRRKWRPTVRLGGPGAGVEASALPEDDAIRALHEALDLPLRVFERDGTRSLIVFDEFQEVLGAHDGMDGLIRSRIQHHGDAAGYVFAGSHPGLMAELFGSRTRPLFGQSRAMTLNPLDDAELAEYIGERFARTGKDIGAALDPLLDLVRGHPQRAMLAAHHLWEATPAGQTADEETWAHASEAMLTELRESFERAWNEMSANERRALAAVAWVGPWGGGDSLFGKATLGRFRLSKGTMRDVRDSLLGRGELERSPGGGVRMVDPVMEAWIASGRRWGREEPE